MRQIFCCSGSRYDQDTFGTAVALTAQLTESPRDAGTKFYDIALQAATASSYRLRTTPKNGQADDGVLEIISSFVKAWDADNSGAIGAGETTWNKY
jgi:hypothetical protein